MSYVVVSNNEDWDNQCVGVVGVVDEDGEYYSDFVEEHSGCGTDLYEKPGFVSLDNTATIYGFCEDQEICHYYSGKAVHLYAYNDDEEEAERGYRPWIYMLVEV